MAVFCLSSGSWRKICGLKIARWLNATAPAEVLRVLLADEVVGHDHATRRMRRKTANFPTGKTLASWRPEESSIPEATQNALTTLEWIGRHENLAVAGSSGTGKSHFVEALAHAAIEQDLRVAWFTLETLTQTMAKTKVDGSIARTVARICGCGCDLIVVDLVDYLQLRRSLGHEMAEAVWLLPGFVAYLDAHDSRAVTIEAALAWANNPRPAR